MARILALDFGLKRTGIAVTDPLQMIATGLTAIETRELFAWLEQYCTREEVERIVIGLPLRADGTYTEMANVIQDVAKKLGVKFPTIPVTQFPERYSSRDAMQVMIAAGVKKSKRQEKGMTDKVAAAVILQNYMQEAVWK